MGKVENVKDSDRQAIEGGICFTTAIILLLIAGDNIILLPTIVFMFVLAVVRLFSAVSERVIEVMKKVKT